MAAAWKIWRRGKKREERRKERKSRKEKRECVIPMVAKNGWSRCLSWLRRKNGEKKWGNKKEENEKRSRRKKRKILGVCGSPMSQVFIPPMH